MNELHISPRMSLTMGVANLAMALFLCAFGSFGWALFNGAAAAYNIAIWRTSTG